MKSFDYSNLYDLAIAKTIEVTEALQNNSRNKFSIDSLKGSVDELQKHADEIMEELNSIKKVAEWDRLVVAFYGETNSGKSTIIEYLRIHFGENEKIKSRNQFREIKSTSEISEKKISTLNPNLERAKHNLNQTSDARLASEKEIEYLVDEQKRRIASLAEASKIEKRNSSIWQRIKYIFKNTGAELEIKRLKIEFDDALTLAIAALKNKKSAEEEARESVAQALSEFDKINQIINNLEKYADGKIIGTGASDTTKSNSHYLIETKHGPVEIIDVPGIEGDEAVVLNNIISAVRRAHVVFLTTNSFAPPGTGESGTISTLQKIREHLSAHTEVWGLINRKINGRYSYLLNRPITPDEQVGINELNQTLRGAIGPSYRGEIVLCALPAFLSIAECLVPMSERSEARAKLIAQISAEEAIEKSQILRLTSMMDGDLSRSAREKIIAANKRKASHTIVKTSEKIDAIINIRLLPELSSIENRTNEAIAQTSGALGRAKTRLRTAGLEATREFVSSVRSEMFAKIDQDVSNDVFKSALKATVAGRQAELEGKLPRILGTELRKFSIELDDIAKALGDQIDKISSLRTKLEDEKCFKVPISLRLSLDRGVRIGALLTSVASGVLLASNPAGWIVLAIGAAGIIISVWKAVRSLFSSEYRKSQQRNCVDENLVRIGDSLTHVIESNIIESFRQLESTTDRFKEALATPREDWRALVESLRAQTHLLRMVSQQL